MNFEGAFILGTAGGFRSNLELVVQIEICTEKFVGFCSVIGVRELCWNNFGNNDGAKESRIIPEF